MTKIEDIIAELGLSKRALQKVKKQGLEGAYTVTTTSEVVSSLRTSLLEKFSETLLYPVILTDTESLDVFGNEDFTTITVESNAPSQALSEQSKDAFSKIADRFEQQTSDPQALLNLLVAKNTDGLEKPGLTDALTTAINNMPPEVFLKKWQAVNNTYQSAFREISQLAVPKRVDDSECKTFNDYVQKAESINVPKWFAANCDLRVKKDEIGSKTKAYSPKPPESDTLMLVPVSKSFYIPAFVHFCANNIDAPPPYVHLAILKRWAELYGTEVYMIGADTLFLSIDKPITDKQVAMQLAIEQSAYCPEVCLSGDGTLSFGALQLLDSNFWQFWWP